MSAKPLRPLDLQRLLNRVRAIMASEEKSRGAPEIPATKPKSAANARGAPTVWVYSFDYLDRPSQSWIRSPAAATIEAISSNGWRVIPGSGREISRDLLSSNGIAFAPSAP